MRARLRAIPTGIDHGTITVLAGGVPHEITTFRSDIDTDGRHATVRFSEDVFEDAKRRDFTMNALYARPDGELVDPLGGIADLSARRVRFIGDAVQRIREDYLRSLRFFRFFAWYGDLAGGLDPDGLAAVADNLDGLAHLSKERVGAEMLKLLSAPDPAQAVAGLKHCGALGMLLPGSDDVAFAPFVHFEQQMALAPDAIARLTALGGDDIPDRLRLSKAQAAHWADLRDQAGRGKTPAHLGYLYGAKTALQIVCLRAASLQMPPDRNAMDEAQKGASAKFPVQAADLMPAFQGKALGEKLRTLEARWIASGFTLSKSDLLG